MKAIKSNRGDSFFTIRSIIKVRFPLIQVYGSVSIINIVGCGKPMILIFAVLLVFFSVLPEASGRIGGSVDLDYGTTNTGEGDTFRQGYTLNYGQSLSEVLGYNVGLNTTIDSVVGLRSRQSMTPFLSLNLGAPDISGNLGYTSERNKEESGRRLVNNNFFLSLRPHLFEKYFRFTGNYSRQRSFDDLSPRQLDTVSDSFRFSMDHGLPFSLLQGIHFSYTLNSSNSLNKVTSSELKNLNGTAGVQFARSILKRITISGGLDLQGSSTKFSVPQPPFIEVFTPFGLWAIDFSPATGKLNDTPALADGDSANAAGISLLDLNNNLGADLAVTRRTGLIYINMQTGFRDESLEVRWEVYRSNDGENWVLVTANPDLFFNFTKPRYEIGFPEQNTRFIKVVNVTKSTERTAWVTEMKVLVQVPGLDRITETTSKELDSNIRLSANLTDSLSLRGSAFYTVDKVEPQEQKDTTISLSANVGYTLSKYLQLNLGANSNSLKESLFGESFSSVTNSYNIALGTQILDFLKPSVSLRLAKNVEDNKVVSKAKSGALNFFFLNDLFPGIEVGFSGNFSERESFSPASVKLDYGVDFEFNMRPKNWISITNSYSVRWGRLEIGPSVIPIEKATAVRSSTTLTVSPIFHVKESLNWKDNDYTVSFQVSWLPTKKLQFSVNYLIDKAVNTRKSLDIGISWKIKQNVNFNAGWEFDFIPGTAKSLRSLSAQLFIRF